MKSWTKSQTTQLGQWLDKKEEKLFMDEHEKYPYLKSFGLGILDGCFIGSIIMYPIVLITCYYWRKKAESK